MSTTITRKLAGLAAGTALVGGSMFGAATPAQAYSPNPDFEVHTKKTGNCPDAKGCHIDDEIDGTNFKKDEGGKGVKIDLTSDGEYLGKVEFHPRGENLYVYDNARDNDTVYVTVVHYDNDGHPRFKGPFKGAAKMDDVHTNLSYDEGEKVEIKVWDSKKDYGTDLIAEATAVA